ncbi:MAG: hypothetical protein HGA47_01400 [Zoogloea sp.]|nr:hypothetical protein [Zoogloea sp.]
MSHNLADDLPGKPGEGSLRVWLKSSAYTKRLLLGEGSDPWGSAAQYLAYFSQAQGLLRPDVAVVDVGELYDSWLARNPRLQAELGSKRRLSFALRKLLEPDGPRQLLAEVVEAVLANLRGQVPLVLAMPSPKHWLYRANVLAGRSDVELDPDSIEDAAMYLADLVRSVSAFGVSGLLLEEHLADRELGETDIERYRPVINVAKHYRWSLVLRPQDEAVFASPTLAEFDAVISPVRRALDGPALGLDVSQSFGEGAALPRLDNREFYFVEVAVDARPEFVLESLARLRA